MYEIQKGWNSTISDEEYHKIEAFHSSSVRHLLRSQAHYAAYKSSHFEQTPAMLWGSLLHSACLQPELFNKNCVVDEYEGSRTKDVVAWRESKQAEGKIITKQEVYDEIISASLKLQVDTTYQSLTKGATLETAGFYRDDDDVLIKIKPDIINKDGILLDLKTTSDARSRAFQRSCSDFYYFAQAALYFDVARELGIPCKAFGWVAIETKPPFEFMIYIADDECMEFGRKQYKQALVNYKQHYKSTGIMGYENKVQELNLPSYLRDTTYL